MYHSGGDALNTTSLYVHIYDTIYYKDLNKVHFFGLGFRVKG